MNKNAKIENIILNKSGYFECINYCNTCSDKCKLLKQSIRQAVEDRKTIRG